MKFTLDYDKYATAARSVVSEGAVLLRNEANALPFQKGTKLAVFGRMQFHYYKSGTGSGGLVNVWKETTLGEALDASEGLVIDEELKAFYKNWDDTNPAGNGIGWGNDLWSQPEMPISLLGEDALAKCAARNDAALIIIARSAGEDHDNSYEEGSYRLQKEEEELLSAVCKAFSRVVVLMNVGNLIDFTFVEKYAPQAVLVAWQGGMMGAEGTVDVLTGIANPSGHLTDTIAKNFEEYPSYPYFGDLKSNAYVEDIFVGYRYFETFKKDAVLYPFGYGLSYTTFSMEAAKCEFDGEFVYCFVNVTNTGDVAGKAVCQFYAEAPQGKLGKAARVLCGFAKTELLAPGESETLIVTITKKEYCSYDDTGVTGEESCFVLEPGTYGIAMGEDVRSAKTVFTFEIPELEVVEECSEAMRPVKAYDRMHASMGEDGQVQLSFEPVSLRSDMVAQGDSFVSDTTGMTRNQMMAEGIITAKNCEPAVSGVKETASGPDVIRLMEVKNGTHTMEEFLAQISDEDLFCFVRGEGMGSPKGTPGTTSAFGGVNEALKALGVPCGCTSDGPSGLRNDCGVKAFSLPNGTMIASTFNRELVEELFTFLGVELRKNRIDTLLGPGMNIHRHPFNGRNFEYFSEDPYVTGQMTVAQLLGMSQSGVTNTLKHFCGNNQEQHRYSVDSVVSERALREIYLRGFEIAVKEGGAYLVMTTYGRVNGLWTASDYELNTKILREEWGFDGMVMTDWWAAINTETRYEEAGSPGSHTNFTRMVAAGNDTYMCCPDGSKNVQGDDLPEMLSAGLLTREMLEQAAIHVLRVLMRFPCMERIEGEVTEVDVLGEMEAWDDGGAKDVPYFKLGEQGTEIPLNLITERNGDFVFGLELEKTGGYQIEVIAENAMEGLVQLPVTLYAWGIPIYCFTWTGADQGEVAKGGKVYFNSNFTVERLHFGQSGLQVKAIRFTYIESVESAATNAEYAHG